ncbi:heavy-metal-associated domain-containing protein [Marinilactibacillus piezotolerans]|uniref:heavy-metal-associated domain-containing protein n=1 Tax=Marinilactibacillus piezotolerans TaxID=258723 RepID=UPI0009AFD76C|nr:cation transporter [Marinilactibacillus piezotolerans]
MEKAVYQLESLTCPSCIKKIETTLKKTAGIDSVKVLFNTSKVKTQFDESTIESSEIKKVIQKLGYSVLSEKKS